MQYLSFQDYDIPLVYVTALSYAKTARVYTNSTGFSRFAGFEAAEVSVRLYLNYGICAAIGEDFTQLLTRWIYAEPSKDTAPTYITLASHIIYPSLQFRVTSINKTPVGDQSGIIDEIEIDLTLSGVECSKAEVQNRSLNFTDSEVIQLPQVYILCKGERYAIGEETTLSQFQISPRLCELEICIGNDGNAVSDRGWLLDVVQESSEIEVEGYGRFYTVSASLVEGVLSLKASVYPKEMTQPITKTLRNISIRDAIKSILPASLLSDYQIAFDGLNAKIDNLIVRDTPINILTQIQAGSGFLTSFNGDKISFVEVPKSFTPTIDFDTYLDSDLVTEPISGLVWVDTVHEYSVGDVTKSSAIRIDSMFTSSDKTLAENCLSYAQYMQNQISFTTALNPQIRHHSAFYMMVSGRAIPVMVEDYTIDFLSNTMSIDAHYVERV